MTQNYHIIILDYYAYEPKICDSQKDKIFLKDLSFHGQKICTQSEGHRGLLWTLRFLPTLSLPGRGMP